MPGDIEGPTISKVAKSGAMDLPSAQTGGEAR